MKTKKEETSFTKTWFILYPFIIYMVIKTISLLCISIAVVSIQENANIVNNLPFIANKQLCAAVGNAMASIIGVAFLYRKFLDETTIRGEYDPDATVWKQTWMRIQTSIKVHKNKWPAFLLIIVIAGTSAIALNMLVQMLQLQSEAYKAVENVQYGIPIWLGLILFGLVSPIVEEIVFRGMLYTRCRRHFNKVIAIGISSFMFGAFHGNILQFLYGFAMGIFMTLAYDLTNSFLGAVLYHMSANVVVYILSTCFQNLIQVNIVNCVIFMTIFIFTAFILCKICQMQKK